MAPAEKREIPDRVSKTPGWLQALLAQLRAPRHPRAPRHGDKAVHRPGCTWSMRDGPAEHSCPAALVVVRVQYLHPYPGHVTSVVT